jgi:hypothetical protein
MLFKELSNMRILPLLSLQISSHIKRGYELNGKRVKEFKPKVNGQITPTKGFPIVMCENTNRDICIATYNSAEHTC